MLYSRKKIPYEVETMPGDDLLWEDKDTGVEWEDEALVSDGEMWG